MRVGSRAFALQTTDAWMDFWFPDAERGEVTKDPGIPTRFEEGMSVIEECSPHYYQWIALPLREVVPIDLCLKGTHSQSFAAWPGQVHVPVTTPLNLLVSLVHECSHQYYHMLQWHTRLVRATAPEAYSALKKVRRPLEKLLKGFHAFGNVMLALQGLEPIQERFSPAHVPSAQDPAMDRELQVIYRASYPEVVKANLELIAGLDKELQVHHQSHFETAGTALYLALRTRLLNAGLLSTGGAA